MKNLLVLFLLLFHFSLFSDTIFYKNGDIKNKEIFSDWDNWKDIEKVQIRPLSDDPSEIENLNDRLKKCQKDKNCSMGKIFLYSENEELYKPNFIEKLHKSIPKYQIYFCANFYNNKDCKENHFSLARKHQSNRVVVIKEGGGLLNVSVYNINQKIEYQSYSNKDDLHDKLNNFLVIENVGKEDLDKKIKEDLLNVKPEKYEGQDYYNFRLSRKEQQKDCLYSNKQDFTPKESCQVIIYNVIKAKDAEEAKAKFFLQNIDQFLKYNDLIFFPMEQEDKLDKLKGIIPGWRQRSLKNWKRNNGIYSEDSLLEWYWYTGSFLISTAMFGYFHNNYLNWDKQRSNFSWMWATQNMPSIALYNFPRFSKINQQYYQSINFRNNSIYLILLTYFFNIINVIFTGDNLSTSPQTNKAVISPILNSEKIAQTNQIDNQTGISISFYW